MLDVLFVGGTIVFFVLMGVFAAGCERIIGAHDDDSTPGGLGDDPKDPT